jgi:hypothetical protein
MNKIGYVFILNDPNLISELKENVSTVISRNPMWIGITNNDEEANQDIIDFMQAFNVPFDIMYNLEDIPDVLKLDQYMSHYKNGWTLVNIVGEDFSIDKYDYVEAIFNSIAPVALVRDESESINNMCFFNIVYKFLHGSKCKMEEETEELVCELFEERVAATQPTMIKTWKDIYDNNGYLTSSK